MNSTNGSSHGRQHLDFLSPEFNRVDDLDDTVGNYRSFEPLSGVITADMRYHEKRKREKRNDTDVDMRSAKPVAEEGEAGGNNIPELLPLTITSGGRTLLIDGDRDRALRCAQLLSRKKMNCTLCRPGADNNRVAVSRIDSFPMIETGRVSVTGSFGGFCATVAACDGRQENLSILAGHRSGSFDLVLDMQPRFSYAGRQLPAGYFAPAGDTSALEAALRELAELRGRFTKPQFTALLTDRCLHGRARHHACRRCVEICSFGACSQDKHRIVVDQYRCQGCGACALVCPAGAIELHNPSQEEMSVLLIERTKKEVEPGKGMHVVLYDGTLEPDAIKASAGFTAIHAVFFEIEEIGRVGLELMLAILACGAAGVTVCCGHHMANVYQALLSQIAMGRNILQGLELPPRLLSLVSPDNPPTAEPLEEPSPSVDVPADFAPARDRRTMIRHAATHLATFSPAHSDVLALPEGSPFGTLAIDESCSLCMACVGGCPTEALCAGGDRPSLYLVEARCHQCGLCAEICPEQAIRLVPRLLLDAGRAGEKTPLREVQPVTCVECGAPFAAGAMIRRIEEKLADHWMFGTQRQRRRLQMCRPCRTRDALLEGGFHR